MDKYHICLCRSITARFQTVEPFEKKCVRSDQQDRPRGWSRTVSTLNRWMWGALCCGVPGIPCFFCNCCARLENVTPDRDRPRVNQSTATVERMIRPHRPHAPRGRKHTPETLSAVRCALSQLQGEPAPPMPPDDDRHSPEPG